MRSVLAVVAVVAAASVVCADDRVPPDRIPQKARELADKGRAFHEAGEYDKAIAAFKEAYVLAPSPALLFNLAQAYRLAGDCDDAAWMYRRYLDTNPGPDRRSLAEQHLAIVEKCGHGGLDVATVEPTIPAPATPGTPARDAPAPPSVAPVESAGERPKRIALWLGIGGGVAVASALYFAFDASDASDQVTSLYQHGGKGKDVASLDARGQRSSALATVLGFGGGLALVGAGVLYAVGRHEASARHIAIAPSPHGAEVSWSWTF
jgi:tetratricopeptide (TPR) repeat protein